MKRQKIGVPLPKKLRHVAMSPVTSPTRASSPAPKNTSTPVKDNPPPEQDTSVPDVHMDTGAQQDAPDTSTDTRGAGTTDNAGASSKSAGIDKGKGPEVPEVRAELEQAASGEATPTAPEKPAPHASALEKTPPAPAKTSIPTTTPVPTPAKAAPTPPAQVKPTTFKMTKIIKEKSATPPASTAMTLHTSKGAARVSSFNTAELDGRGPMQTKSGNSLDSLKEYYLMCNAADVMDMASSGKKKAPAGTQALIVGNPPDIPARPRAIASELFSIQQRLYLVADANTVSIYPYIFPVPENVGCLEYGHSGFSNISFNLAEFQIQHIS
jgi:hypothetical protein